MKNIPFQTDKRLAETEDETHQKYRELMKKSPFKQNDRRQIIQPNSMKMKNGKNQESLIERLATLNQ